MGLWFLVSHFLPAWPWPTGCWDWWGKMGSLLCNPGYTLHTLLISGKWYQGSCWLGLFRVLWQMDR